MSFDFAVGIVPGWHSTIFPPYFVAGAIFSGFAMVLTLAIPLRAVRAARTSSPMRHLDNMAKVMLATGLIVAYGYVMEAFMAWYSGNSIEEFMMRNRMVGPYWPSYWLLICSATCVDPAAALVRAGAATHLVLFWVIAIVVNVGMWLERFVIVVTSLHRDFVPRPGACTTPTFWDWATFSARSACSSLFFLFVRVLPVISISEMRELVHVKDGHPAPSDEHATRCLEEPLQYDHARRS